MKVGRISFDRDGMNDNLEALNELRANGHLITYRNNHHGWDYQWYLYHDAVIGAQWQGGVFHSIWLADETDLIGKDYEKYLKLKAYVSAKRYTSYKKTGKRDVPIIDRELEL